MQICTFYIIDFSETDNYFSSQDTPYRYYWNIFKLSHGKKIEELINEVCYSETLYIWRIERVDLGVWTLHVSDKKNSLCSFDTLNLNIVL